MSLDWIFGPLEKRAYVLDIDTVRQIANTVREKLPHLDVYFTVVHPTTLQTTKVGDDIETLSIADRARLRLVAHDHEGQEGTPRSNYGMSFMRYEQPSINFEDVEFERKLRGILADSRRPRFRLLPWKVFVAAVPFTLLSVTWLWVLATIPLSMAVVAFGFTLVLGAFLLTVPAVRLQRDIAAGGITGPKLGHRILNESRADTFARRADTHMNIKVAIVTALITVAVTLLAAWVLGALAVPVDPMDLL